jgi:hypothetical protein
MSPTLCIVCLEPISSTNNNNKPAVKLPCKCASIMCFEDFQTFMNSYSACPICRERIVPRLRRLLNGKPLESLIDCSIGNSSNIIDSENENNNENQAIQRIPTIPGELHREIEAMYAKFKAERDLEEQASLEFLKTDEDLKLLQADEELAKLLHSIDNDTTTTTSTTSTTSLEHNTNNLSSSSSSRNNSTSLIIDLTSDDVDDDKNILPTFTTPISSTSSSSSSINNISVPPIKRIRPSSGNNNNTCWICQACTYAENSELQLRCSLCRKLKVDPIDVVYQEQLELEKQSCSQKDNSSNEAALEHE